MPRGETTTRHAALPAHTARRRRYAHPGHGDVGQSVRSLWVSPDHSTAPTSRLAGRQGPGGADLASRGAEGPKKQTPRDRLWLNDESCVRLRPEHVNHVWSYDFVSSKTHDGRTVRMLNLIDEHSRECLTIRPERRWSSAKVIEALTDVMVMKGVPEHLRSDNGPEFVARDLRKWPCRYGSEDGLYRARKPLGERLLRELQLEAAGRVPERRNLLLDEGNQGAGGTLASAQHCPAALLAGLPTTGTSGLGCKELGVWRSGNRYALPTSPHPRLRRDINDRPRYF